MSEQGWLRRIYTDGQGEPTSGLGHIFSSVSSGSGSPSDERRQLPWRPHAFQFASWSLRARLFAIVLALALPLNLVIVAVVWSLAGAAQNAQRTSLLYSARSVASALDAELGKYLALAMALSRSPALHSGDLAPFEQEARRTFETVPDAWVVVADLDGQQLLNTASPTQHALPKRLAIALNQQRQVFETGRPMISGIRLGPFSHLWTAVIDVPIFKDGHPYRALVVTMTTAGFVRLFNAPDLPKNWLAGIIDGDGRYIARVPDHETVVGKLASEGWRQTIGRPGLFEFTSREGDAIVNANEISKLANWTVGIGIKKSQLTAAAWQATRWAIVTGSLLSVLSLLLATQLARRISGHLSALQSNAKALLAGRSGSAKVPTVPEMSDVWSTLQSAAQERNATEERLRRSHETYFRLIKNAMFGVYLVDADFRLAEVSAGAQKVFENVKPLIGREFGEVLRIIWPEAFAQEVIGLFHQTLTTGEPYQCTNTCEVRSDTAEREAYDWRLERVALPDGRFGVVCYFYDLTERLRHEEHVRLLMNELNHRSKNMIGLVQAIARRTEATSVPDFVERFSQRLQSLAANQDILVKTEWRGADLKEVARAQLATFADRTSGRIFVSGPSLLVNSRAAQAIGMALHELATNAAKYGALSNDRGSVEVTWTVADGTLSCAWTEHDGPRVAAPERQGFGSTVINQMVRMSVGGSVTLDYAACGLNWRLDCPLDNVTAAAGSCIEDLVPQ